MALSASWMTGTMKLNSFPLSSGEGTGVPWQTSMQSTDTEMYLLPRNLNILLRSVMVLANCLGEAMKKSSRSRSTPSMPYTLTALMRVERKVCRLDSDENALIHWLLGPPTDSHIFLPVFLQLLTSLLGKLSASTETAPLGVTTAYASRTWVALALTSSLMDSPQQLPPKPQQATLRMLGTAETHPGRATSSTMLKKREVLIILPVIKQQSNIYLYRINPHIYNL